MENYCEGQPGNVKHLNINDFTEFVN